MLLAIYIIDDDLYEFEKNSRKSAQLFMFVRPEPVHTLAQYPISIG